MSAAQPVHPYVHVVVVAIIGAVAVLAWLLVFETINRLLWENDFVTANRWVFPVICLPFSLAVGLLVKYRNAPTNLDESMLDSLGGDVSQDRLAHAPGERRDGLALAVLRRGHRTRGRHRGHRLEARRALQREGRYPGRASIAARVLDPRLGLQRPRSPTRCSPGVLGHRSSIKDPETKGRTLPANLIGGSIGYLIFFAAGSSGLENYLHLPASPAVHARGRRPRRALRAARAGAGADRRRAVPGRGGDLRAVRGPRGRAGARRRRSSSAPSAMVAPIVLFSGESQIRTVVADPAGVRAGPAAPHGVRQARPARRCVQERVPRRADVPGHLRLDLRRPRPEPGLPGHPGRRADRRRDGRVPAGPLQGPVHGHPADRRHAPGRAPS